MPDTIRTLAELNVQFADNTSEVISPQDIRDLMVSMMVHGEIGSGAKASITLGTGFQAMDFTVAGIVSRGVTIDTTNKWIAAIPVSLRAQITLEVMFKGTSGVTYNFTAFKNPDGTPVQIARLNAEERIINAAQIGKIIVSAAIDLNAGDKIQAGVQANGAAFELLRGNLKLQRIGVE